ncbi:MAG: 2-oxo-4-hydroxy-4-carboxy-5-ureidoimidazoline decarboxylase [Nocardioidaceae bacterium]
MRIEDFNALSVADARAALDPCLGVDRWVDEVESGRPYDDAGALLVQAQASAENLTDDELDAALARHPRIGEHPAADDAGADFSRREQAGVSSDDSTAHALHQGNAAYEKRFDRVFLIRAADRSRAEILAELTRRLQNDEVAERREVVTQLREIALRRLGEVVDA